jgi:hypothetical protein
MMVAIAMIVFATTGSFPIRIIGLDLSPDRTRGRDTTGLNEIAYRKLVLTNGSVHGNLRAL